MKNLVLLYSSSVSSYILFKDLLAKHPDSFSAIIQVPHIPARKSATERNTKIFKTAAASSPSYIVFNLLFLHFFSLISGLFGNSLRSLARKHGIPHSFHGHISDDLLTRLRELNPDYVFNTSGFILGTNILSIPGSGVINFHGAPLPEFRGAANYVWLLLEERQSTHGTLHFVERGLDTGDVIATSREVGITRGMSAARLYLEILHAGKELLEKKFEVFASNNASGTPQPGAGQARSFPKKADIARLRSKGHRMTTLADIGRIVSLAVTGRL